MLPSRQEWLVVSFLNLVHAVRHGQYGPAIGHTDDGCGFPQRRKPLSVCWCRPLIGRFLKGAFAVAARAILVGLRSSSSPSHASSSGIAHPKSLRHHEPSGRGEAVCLASGIGADSRTDLDPVAEMEPCAICRFTEEGASKPAAVLLGEAGSAAARIACRGDGFAATRIILDHSC